MGESTEFTPTDFVKMQGIMTFVKRFRNSFGAGIVRFDEYRSQVKRDFPALLPGLIFILLGIVTLFAPRLLIAVLATLFLFVGGCVCVIAWKFQQLRRKLEATMQQFQGRVYIEGVNVQEPFKVKEENDKKIVFH